MSLADYVDPRNLATQQLGTKLRDAAVDPLPGDFLGPINAGVEGPEGNPHGPNVVNPEIHGLEENRGIVPGLVSGVAATQQNAEVDSLRSSLGITEG